MNYFIDSEDFFSNLHTQLKKKTLYQKSKQYKTGLPGFSFLFFCGLEILVSQTFFLKMSFTDILLHRF